MCYFEPVSPCSTERHVGSEAMQDLSSESERPRRGARARVVVAPTRLDKFLNHEENRFVCWRSFYRASLILPSEVYELTLRRQIVGSA